MEFKVFLTNLAKYNEGHLIGKWINLPLSDEELQAELAEVLGSDEEYFITDYESTFNIQLGEYEVLEDLNQFAKDLEEIEEYYSAELMEAAFSEFGREEALRVLENGDYSYLSDVTNYKELGERVVDEGLFGEIPDSLLFYIDHEAIGRDWSVDYTIYRELGIAVRWF